MSRRIFALFFLVISTALLNISTAFAGTEDDEEYRGLYSKFMQLYNKSGHEKEFYQVADKMCAYFREHDMVDEYYKTQLNICLYDTQNDHPMKAMDRTNAMLEEMKEEGYDGYSHVYLSLGTIYESRGNYRIARYYYEKSIHNLPSDDMVGRMSLYSRMAYLLMFHNPVDAKIWNDKYQEESKSYPPYRQIYLFINCMIDFTVNNKHDFEQAYKYYREYMSEHPDLDHFGDDMVEIAQLAFNEKYEVALNKLNNSKHASFSDLNRYDIKIIIYKMMGQMEQAFNTSQQRMECIDSLFSDMLYNNLNKANSSTDMALTKSLAAQKQRNMLFAILIMSIIIIVMLVFVVMYFRRSKQHLHEKNKQLTSALAMAEEGEKMKTEFVRSVSHEIRTPLNAINGFNELLNTPGLDLPEEERADLLHRIEKNVQDITQIVDEMLRIADKESNEFYPKSDKIYCNQFLQSIIYSYRSKCNAHVELQYTTKVINRFQILTNTEGLRKVLEQVIENAIKFTKEGFIRLHCERSADEKKLLISVSDSGCGVPKEQQEHIFDGFYKVDSFEQGIGLGLAVSKKIATKLGGDLIIDSKYIGGARFVLSIPIEEHAPQIENTLIE